MNDVESGGIGPTVSGFVPQGVSVPRALVFQRLAAEGHEVALAAALAYLEHPWVDGAEAPEAFVSELNSLPRQVAPTIEDASSAVESVRELAMAYDAVDYVIACDKLLAGLEFEIEAQAARLIKERTTDLKADEEDSFWTPAQVAEDAPDVEDAGELRSWLADAAFTAFSSVPDVLPDLPLRAPVPTVDYGTAVPRSLFDATLPVLRRLAFQAHIAAGAETLRDVITWAADNERVLHEAGVVRVHTLLDEVRQADLSRAMDEELASLTPRERDVVQRRVLTEPRVSLEDIGVDHGLTRERVRQIQAKAEKRLAQRLGPVVFDAARCIRQLLPSTARAELFHAALHRIAPARAEHRAWVTREVSAAAGYVQSGEWFVQPTLEQLLRPAKDRIDDLTDDRGFVDFDALRKEFGLGQAESEFVREQLGLPELHGYVMKARTQRNQLVAAIQHIGRPATREELLDVIGVEGAGRTIFNYLVSLPFIVRVTKDTWGFQEWTDNPYDGIAEEIAQRIEEDGGESSVAEIMAEFPVLFGVAEGSIRTYLSTPRFLLSNGRVRLASQPQRKRHRTLSQHDRVTVLADGTPVLRVDLHERHFSGYSVKIPPALAEHQGVGIDQATRVPIVSPDNCGEASLIWRAQDPLGPEFGRLRQAFEQVGTPGNPVYIECRSDGLHISALEPKAPREPAEPITPTDGVAELLARLKKRRQF
jgi:hypothetical protein